MKEYQCIDQIIEDSSGDGWRGLALVGKGRGVLIVCPPGLSTEWASAYFKLTPGGGTWTMPVRGMFLKKREVW